MSATETFTTWLIDKRKREKLTYVQLSERSGVSTGSIYGLEHGKGSPSLDTVEKLCKALGTSVESALRVRTKKEYGIVNSIGKVEFPSANYTDDTDT